MTNDEFRAVIDAAAKAAEDWPYSTLPEKVVTELLNDFDQIAFLVRSLTPEQCGVKVE